MLQTGQKLFCSGINHLNDVKSLTDSANDNGDCFLSKTHSWPVHAIHS